MNEVQENNAKDLVESIKTLTAELNHFLKDKDDYSAQGILSDIEFCIKSLRTNLGERE